MTRHKKGIILISINFDEYFNIMLQLGISQLNHQPTSYFRVHLSISKIFQI